MLADMASVDTAVACCVLCRLLGPRFLEVVSGSLNRWTNHLVPQWNPYIPKVSTRM